MIFQMGLRLKHHYKEKYYKDYSTIGAAKTGITTI